MPEEDLLFLRRHITNEEEVDAWLRDTAEDYCQTVLALAGGEVVGYATVTHAAERAFERMGFISEAVLRGQVVDRLGRAHDLRIMSIDVEEFRQRLESALAQAETTAHASSI